MIHLYLARGLKQMGAQLEPEERIEPVYMSIADVRDALSEYRFTDSKTAIIAARALAWLDNKGF